MGCAACIGSEWWATSGGAEERGIVGGQQQKLWNDIILSEMIIFMHYFSGCLPFLIGYNLHIIYTFALRFCLKRLSYGQIGYTYIILLSRSSLSDS